MASSECSNSLLPQICYTTREMEQCNEGVAWRCGRGPSVVFGTVKASAHSSGMGTGAHAKADIISKTGSDFYSHAEKMRPFIPHIAILAVSIFFVYSLVVHVHVHVYVCGPFYQWTYYLDYLCEPIHIQIVHMQSHFSILSITERYMVCVYVVYNHGNIPITITNVVTWETVQYYYIKTIGKN